MKTVGIAVVAVVAAAAGFGIYRFGIAPRLEQSAELPSVEQSAAEQMGVPQVLPEFSLQDREGSVRSIRSWEGKSMIVNFWATWCAPCRREIPLLKEIQQSRADEGFQVVGVAVDFRDDVLKYAGEIGIDYPILIGEQDGLDAVTKFGIASVGFPFTVFTDAKANIVAMHLGELTKPQSEIFLDVVAQVNRGELTPATARTVAAKQLAGLEPSES